MLPALDVRSLATCAVQPVPSDDSTHRDRQPDPARHESATEVAVREDDDVVGLVCARCPVDLPAVRDDAVDARLELVGRLAAGEAVAEREPAWALGEDLARTQACLESVCARDGAGRTLVLPILVLADRVVDADTA